MRLTLGLVTLALTLTACGSGSDDTSESTTAAASTTPASVTVTGSVAAPIDPLGVVNAKNPTVDQTPCTSIDNYSQVAEGAQVTVKNSDGKTVALAKLEGGRLSGKAGGLLITSDCKFTFTIEDLPPGSEFYSFSVAGVPEVTVPAARLDQPVVLKVG